MSTWEVFVKRRQRENLSSNIPTIHQLLPQRFWCHFRSNYSCENSFLILIIISILSKKIPRIQNFCIYFAGCSSNCLQKSIQSLTEVILSMVRVIPYSRTRVKCPCPEPSEMAQDLELVLIDFIIKDIYQSQKVNNGCLRKSISF